MKRVKQLISFLRVAFDYPNWPLLPLFPRFIRELNRDAQQLWPEGRKIDDSDVDIVGPLACTAALLGDVVAFLGVVFVAIAIAGPLTEMVGLAELRDPAALRYMWLGLPAVAISPLLRYSARLFEMHRRERMRDRYMAKL